MKETGYFIIRARHYFQLALETGDPNLKAAYQAIAADMSAKLATADSNREVFLIDGVAVDATNDVPHKLRTSDPGVPELPTRDRDQDRLIPLPELIESAVAVSWCRIFEGLM